MKIVVTGTRGIPNILGGVETHCQELFPRIAQKDIDIVLIRRKNYIHDDYKEYKGVKLIDINSPKKKALEAIIHTYRAIIKAKKLHANIIHIHAIGPALLTPFAKLLGLKVVFTHHGPDYDRDKWGIPAKIMLKLGERMGCKYADKIIVISEVINDIIVRKYHRRDAKLIYNGVPAPHRIIETDYLNELRVESQKYIFAMGRFVPEKNFHQLIHSFAALQQKEYKLVLAGDTDFEDKYSLELKTLAHKHGVILTGFIKGKKLHQLLTHARVFVLPSSHEGLPIALLEAMSYDLPVIVSNIPANLEINLPRDCYFEAGNQKQLHEKLQAGLTKEFHPIKYAMEEYDWEKIAAQVIEMYEEIK